MQGLAEFTDGTTRSLGLQGPRARDFVQAPHRAQSRAEGPSGSKESPTPACRRPLFRLQLHLPQPDRVGLGPSAPTPTPFPSGHIIPLQGGSFHTCSESGCRRQTNSTAPSFPAGRAASTARPCRPGSRRPSESLCGGAASAAAWQRPTAAAAISASIASGRRKRAIMTASFGLRGSSSIRMPVPRMPSLSMTLPLVCSRSSCLPVAPTSLPRDSLRWARQTVTAAPP